MQSPNRLEQGVNVRHSVLLHVVCSARQTGSAVRRLSPRVRCRSENSRHRSPARLDISTSSVCAAEDEIQYESEIRCSHRRRSAPDAKALRKETASPKDCRILSTLFL